MVADPSINTPESDGSFPVQPMHPTSYNAPVPFFGQGSDITPEENAQIKRCVALMNYHHDKNQKRWNYYNGRIAPTNLGLAFKESAAVLDKVRARCDWTKTSVEKLAERSRLDYFSFDGLYSDDSLHQAWEDNMLGSLYHEASVSELINAFVVFSVTLGDVSAGEPAVIVSAHSALESSVIWDYRKKRIGCGLIVTDIDNQYNPIAYNFFTDDYIIEMVKGGQTWTTTRHKNSIGRIALEPMVFHPSLERPLGTSRITKSSMCIVSNALREITRLEVASEIFTAPQRYIVGADADTLDELGLTNYWNSYLGVEAAEDTNVSVGQFNPPGLTDHILYMKQLASQFSGETGIPVTQLGVMSDEPSSADAIHAEQEGLIIEAERMNELNGRAMSNVAKLIMATSSGVRFSELTPQQRSVMPKWQSPTRPSMSVVSDAALKMVQAIPGLADTDEIMQRLGFTDEEIRSIKKQISTRQGLDLLNQLAAKQTTDKATTTEQPEEQSTKQPADEVTNDTNKGGTA